MRFARYSYVLFAVALGLTATLAAAEFWEAKPVAEWSDKDIQKLANNSPWAHQTRSAFNDGRPSSGVDATASGPPSVGPQSGPGSPGSVGRPGGLGGAPSVGSPAGGIGGNSPTDTAAAAPEIEVTVRWLTALPMREAQMRAKYGKEIESSPEAQKYIEQRPPVYTLGISGLPGNLVSAGGGDRAKDAIQKQTTLSSKGKEPLRPETVQFVPNGSTVDVLLAFPRAPAITLEDKEVELTTHIGPVTIRQRFRLKDMQVHGKLEL